jgi:hypothetical protein
VATASQMKVGVAFFCEFPPDSVSLGLHVAHSERPISRPAGWPVAQQLLSCRQGRVWRNTWHQADLLMAAALHVSQ